MDGINAYARPSPDGQGVTIDFEPMAVDLATVAKAGGYTRDQFMEFIGHVFDEAKVDVKIPPSAKS